MSTSRAKKKRRQRARAAGEAPGSGGARSAGEAPGGGGAKAARGASAGGGTKAARGASAGGGTKAARGASAGGGAKAARGASAGGGTTASRGAGAQDGEARANPSRLDIRDGVAAPKPIWAPFPLTEIGMAAGIAIFGAGFATSSARTLAIGALVLAVVTAELCLREHFAGFRSHALLLAALPVAILHGIVVLAISDAYRGPLTLAVDLAAGGALAWWLRARFHRARERNRAP